MRSSQTRDRVVNCLERALHPATVGTLDEAQFGQNLHVVMNPPNVACHASRQLPHRYRALPLQRVNQFPAPLGQLAKETALAALVVEADHPDAAFHMDGPVLETVVARRARQMSTRRFRHS
jgi:hypothetical protein